MFNTGNKYRRAITQTLPDMGVPVGTSIVVDVYDVCDAFAVEEAGLTHAIKKLLCVGIRGHKNSVADLREAMDAIERVIQKQEVSLDIAKVESGSGSMVPVPGAGDSQGQSLIVAGRATVRPRRKPLQKRAE